MILVVDDDPQVRATIVRAVTELGYLAAEAGDAAGALAVVRDGGISLAILDYVMPDMNGTEIGRSIAEIDPELPLIFSTGHAALRALRSAAGEDVEVLEKPFTLDELETLLTDKLAERRRRLA